MLDRYSVPDCCSSFLSSVGLLTVLLFGLGVQPAVAQVTVEGTVTDAETDAPLPGVNVVQVGTERGATTDVNGTFQIDVLSENAELRFSFVGYQTKTVALDGRTELTVRLARATEELEGVVVTALGVEDEERSLGYSVDEVEAAEVDNVPRVSVAGALAGRVSGVQVSQAGSGTGGSSRIIVRGSNSIDPSKSNQALIVVDGIPINNSQIQQAGAFGGFDYGDGITNLNPADVESISVLKGPNAAALYGTRAANGAVAITTKKGGAEEGIGVSYQGSFSVESPTVWPDEEFQNVYGRGSQGQLCLGSESECTTADGTPISDPSLERSFGPRMEGQEVQRFNGEVAPFSPQENNVKDFYERGSTVRNAVSLRGGVEDASVRASYTNLQSEGLLPGQEVDQNAFTLSGTANLTDRLSATGWGTYLKREAFNRPNLSDIPDNTVRNFLFMPRSVRLQDLKPFRTPNGQPVIWNNRVPDPEQQNPFWTVNLNTNTDERDRLIGYLTSTYEFTDWLSLQLRGGTDLYTGTRNWRRADNTLFEVGSPGRAKFQETRVRVEEINYDALITAEGALTEAFSGELRLGGNRFIQNQRINGFQGSGTSVPNFFTEGNAVSSTPIEGVTRREIQSLYALGEIGYRDVAFLSVTGRNDWSSTLPEGERSFFYPSVSGSVILTDALNLDLSGLSYAKLRASWAQTGNDASPFQLDPTFELGGGLGGSFSGRTYATVGDVRPNAEVEPEITTSFEVGADLRLIDDRVTLEATYFTESTENQVVSIPLSSTSGFSSRVINVGEVQNYGIEGRIKGTIFATGTWRWDLSFNAATLNSEVTDFPGDITTQLLGSSRSGVQVVAEEGEPFGQIFGSQYKRNDDGEIVVDANGIPKPAEERGVIGNYQPDWTGGLGTTLRWNNLRLQALVDVRQGGEIYSFSNVVAHQTGNHEATLRGREDGFVFDGVTESGSQNDVSVDPQTFWGDVAAPFGGGIDEEFVYDASYVRLREVSIAYDLPEGLVGATPVRSAQIRLTGENLFFFERHTDGFDPSAYARSGASGVQGIEYASFPNTRSFGVNVNLTF